MKRQTAWLGQGAGVGAHTWSPDDPHWMQLAERLHRSAIAGRVSHKEDAWTWKERRVRNWKGRAALNRLECVPKSSLVSGILVSASGMS
jgi:hypothetical protein